MNTSGSYQSSNSRGILVENKQCPRCNKRANIRTSGVNAANPFKLYYKCDGCDWFQWCQARNDTIYEDNASVEIQQGGKHQIEKVLQELKKKIKEQTHTISETKGRIEELFYFLRFSIKVAFIMYVILVVVCMNKGN